MESEKPNGTEEEIKLNILHQKNGYYVSNEETKKHPSYQVWVPGMTHAKLDSAYQNLELAVSRCNYLAKTNDK